MPLRAAVSLIFMPLPAHAFQTDDARLQPIAEKVAAQQRLDADDALALYRSKDILVIGWLANQVRERMHGDRTYFNVNRHINPTNVCVAACRLCAFGRKKDTPGAYTMALEEAFQTAASGYSESVTEFHIVGGLHPDLPFQYFLDLCSGLKQRFPQVHLHCYSASEVIAIAEYSELSIRDTILRLREAGLDSIPGGGAEILDDEVRYKIARLKCLTEDWLNVHRTAHQLGMRTTATMMFGCGEKYEHRVNHLQRLYELQEETGGFTAFIPWSFQPANTALGGRHWDEATSVEYLKTLAISRLYLSNFLNVQSSWVTQGLKVCQLGLRFGGNDVGSVMLEENVVKAAGVNNCTTEEELRRIIRDAGFRPAQRDTLYRTYFLN